MGEKIAFKTRMAPELGGPYSQAIVHNGLIYVSGQGPIDPVTNQVAFGTIEEETRLTMNNIRVILDAAGSSVEKVLKVTVNLLRMKEYSRFNKVYEDFFIKNLPARSCIEARRLPFGISIEIDVIAYI